MMLVAVAFGGCLCLVILAVAIWYFTSQEGGSPAPAPGTPPAATPRAAGTPSPSRTPPATGTPSPSRTPPATGTPPATPSTCPANKYLSGGSCVNCPAGAYSEAGSSSASACYCGGHTQMNSSRTACVDCPAPAAGYVWSSFIGCDVKLSSSYPPGSRREGQSCERDEDCGGVSPNGYQDTCSPTGFCMSNG